MIRVFPRFIAVSIHKDGAERDWFDLFGGEEKETGRDETVKK